jgi:hypothetical protein
MRLTIGAAGAALLLAGAAANADMVLHLDVNSVHIQATNSAGANSAFGGLNHTGAIHFSFAAGASILAGIDTQTNGAPPVNQNFTGSLVNFTGVINLNSGMVTGGNLAVNINSGDSYTAQVVPGDGAVSRYVGGGFKIEGLTFDGHFTDSLFGNVNVAPWFNAQQLGGLLGSFLQFNFDPDPTGASFSDMDIFVDAQVVPLPAGAWAGLATLAGIMVANQVRRRR